MEYEKVLSLWTSYTINSGDDLDRYLHNFRILFAYNSGKIENSVITFNDTREIFENGRVSGFTGDPRALFEQQNQKLCYEYLKDRIAAREALSLELVREVHRILTSGTYDERRFLVNEERPGKFKKHDYVTGILEVGSAAEDVETDMSALLVEVNGYAGTGVLKAAAYFHARFEYIHPFSDGNGRVGRTLLNYYLMINGHPPLIVYEEDKNLYYDSLRVYDEREEIEPLYRFLVHCVEKTWDATARTAGGEKPGRKPMNDLMES